MLPSSDAKRLMTLPGVNLVVTVKFIAPGRRYHAVLQLAAIGRRPRIDGG
jgi:hypothetical protein